MEPPLSSLTTILFNWISLFLFYFNLYSNFKLPTPAIYVWGISSESDRMTYQPLDKNTRVRLKQLMQWMQVEAMPEEEELGY
jgi:hypothetical protein